MMERSASALKEWAAVEQILGTGGVTVLLRKGGLWERREGFEMEHRQFWLFPTLYHQNPHELKPELAWALESARAAHPGGDRVRLDHFATVADAFRLEDAGTLSTVLPYQALTEDTLEARFHYRNRPYLHALLVRVYRMPQPHIIPNTLGYEGCVSWVELDEELGTSGAVPVLDDSAFEVLRREIISHLSGRSDVVPI